MILGLVALAATTAAPAPASIRPVAESVVHLQVYRSRADWNLPWRMTPVDSAVGSGFLIEGSRVITNAHVVADAREILVRRPDQANPYVATVAAVGNDCDLAVLQVKDPAFAIGLKPLALGTVPRSGSRVLTYGFPLGGQDVSSTAGIVSRVESRGYVHSGIDAHLVVQTDAAINPGNSGGPVVQDGRVVGVAFQGYPGFDNMGFFIPVPVVRHFLADLDSQGYEGFPDSGLSTSTLLSPAYRRERGLPPGRSGVVVDQVAPGGTAFGVLERGDVILAVDGITVANDGTVLQADARVTFEHLFDMKQVGQPVKVTVWRGGKEQILVATSRHIPRLENHRNRYGVAPRYVVYAGLVFMPLDTELLKVWGRNWLNTADRNLVWHHLFREAEDPQSADREVVVLTRVLRHPANSQFTFARPVAVDKINGIPIRSLADVVSALEGNHERFHLLEFEGAAGIEALDREKADAAHAEILKQYAIPRDRHL
jgi:S1-C subfamily serine protease